MIADKNNFDMEGAWAAIETVIKNDQKVQNNLGLI